MPDAITMECALGDVTESDESRYGLATCFAIDPWCLA
jgi:hypothetical protein